MNHKDLADAARAVLDYKPKLCIGHPCTCSEGPRLLHKFQQLAHPRAILALLEENNALQRNVDNWVQHDSNRRAGYPVDD